MKLSLNEHIGPLIGIVCGSIAAPTVLVGLFGELGLLELGLVLACPWFFVITAIDTVGHGEMAVYAAILEQALVYSAVLATGCLRDRLRKVAAWLLLIHLGGAIVAVVMKGLKLY
jgi:hypothetical protein